ncbi:hypothetical protein SDC9_124756 [bioreactor metagenome]|uniref:Uncharacterized protein n=1 Tax=bioreactor metagenome TaxID=1076179 RepID=A0A645CLJ4_9ZZZZ
MLIFPALQPRRSAGPLGQTGGKIQNNPQLGKFRGLKLGQPGKFNPPLRTVDRDAQPGHLDQNQQDEGAAQNQNGEPAQCLVIQLGGEIHHRHAGHGEQRLPPDIENRIVSADPFNIIVGRGIGG